MSTPKNNEKGLTMAEYFRVVSLIPEEQLTKKEQYYRRGMNKELKRTIKRKK